MKEIEAKKTAVSNFLKDKYLVLDLFYKSPCNSCKTINEWKKFSFFPDLLIQDRSKRNYFCFIILNEKDLEDAKKFKERNEFIEYKFFLLSKSSLYVIDNFKKKILCENLRFVLPHLNSIEKTYKSNHGWEEKRKQGAKGEEYLKTYLKKLDYNFFELNFNAPCDSCSQPENWKKFNKLPDGIFKYKKEIMFYEAKSKSKRNFIVNLRDYKEYLEKTKFLNIVIFFLIFDYKFSKCNEIYSHDVKDMNITIKRNKQWDGNIVVDLSNHIKQLQ